MSAAAATPREETAMRTLLKVGLIVLLFALAILSVLPAASATPSAAHASNPISHATEQGLA